MDIVFALNVWDNMQVRVADYGPGIDLQGAEQCVGKRAWHATTSELHRSWNIKRLFKPPDDEYAQVRRYIVATYSPF